MGMPEFCRMLISAVNRKEAERMVDALLEAGLVAGAFIFEGHSRYHWKGKILSRDDCNISAFSPSSTFNRSESFVTSTARVSISTP